MRKLAFGMMFILLYTGFDTMNIYAGTCSSYQDSVKRESKVKKHKNSPADTLKIKKPKSK